jgi:hypothetical protein
METCLFPADFFDFQGVADLAAEHKLVLAACAVNMRTSCCGVITITPYSVSALPLPFDTIVGICVDADRRGIVAFDKSTREVFIKNWFDWQRVPADEDDSPWARQVRAAVAKVQSGKVRDALNAVLMEPPAARIPSALLSTNLLTALPSRGKGEKWSASESLVAFALAANPDQTPAGVFSPDFYRIGLLCSLPENTVKECVNSLSAAGALVYDEASGEVLIPARLRAATWRHARAIADAARQIRSPLILQVFQRECARRDIKLPAKTLSCAPVQCSSAKYIKGEGSVLDRQREADAFLTKRGGVDVFNEQMAVVLGLKKTLSRRHGARTGEAWAAS